MKFKILRTTFLDGLKSVQNVIPSKSSQAILQNVLIEAVGNNLVMTTTDLYISIRSSVECDIIEEGSTTLPVKLLLNSVSKAAEGIIEVDIDSNECASIVAGSAKFRITGLPSSGFPNLPHDEDAYAYELDSQTLKEMIRKTSYAASQDDTRRTLKGVLMSFKDMKLTMVASDGRRLALVEKEIDFPSVAQRDIVLPFKAVQELQRSISGEGIIKVMVQKSQICFETGCMKLYSKLTDDVYPNFYQVIPKSCTESISVDRQLLLNAIDRVSVMTMDEAHSIKLIFDDNRLVVTSAVNEIGSASDEVAIKYSGEKIEIMFNPNYVMDPLKAIDDDEIKIELNNGHSPAVIKCSIPFLYVIMPLRSA